MSSTHSTSPAGIHARGTSVAAMRRFTELAAVGIADPQAARRAMVAVDRAALAHDLAGEDDPDVREFLTRELDALASEATR